MSKAVQSISAPKDIETNIVTKKNPVPITFTYNTYHEKRNTINPLFDEGDQADRPTLPHAQENRLDNWCNLDINNEESEKNVYNIGDVDDCLIFDMEAVV